MRPIRPRGAVRFGVFGSLSIMTSVMANTLRIITAGSEPLRDSRRVRLSQPRCTAHATAACGVSERNPPTRAIRNANNTVIYSPKKPYEHAIKTYALVRVIGFAIKNGEKITMSMHCLVYKREAWKLRILLLALLISLSACMGSW